jgi:hypothetical protein
MEETLAATPHKLNIVNWEPVRGKKASELELFVTSIE